MTGKAVRVFVPVSRFVGRTSVPTQVVRWEWRRGRGLRCFYTDGTVVRSDYRGLRKLFAGETVREVLA